MSKLLKRISKIATITLTRLREQGLRTTFLWLLEHGVRILTGAPRKTTSVIEPGLVVGGQYRRRGWARLAGLGVTGVLNLRAEYCDRDAGIAPPSYLRLATIDDEAPAIEQLREGVAFVEQEVARGGGVYIHCGAGVGRAATMAAAYFVARGDSPVEAWKRIRAVRPFVRPTARQQAAIEAWSQSVKGEGLAANGLEGLGGTASVAEEVAVR